MLLYPAMPAILTPIQWGSASLPTRCLSLLALASPLFACTPAAEPDPIPRRSDILLVTVDTLRADHLSSYGYPRLTSPNLDRLAAEGVRFDLPIVQWPKTGPSFASMLTSTYAKDNGIVRQIGIPVPQEMTLLAERLAAAGYATRAVVSNGALSREFGFDQGFEEYIESWRNPRDPAATKVPAVGGTDPNGAARVTDLALHLADGLAAARGRDGGDGVEGDPRPYFLWVHYIDPHFPYTPPEPFTDRFQNDEHWRPEPRVSVSTDSRRRQMTGIGYSQVLDQRQELAFYVARYDAEIAYADHEIGRLLAELESRDLHRRRLTVVTADHGESLGEHHYYFDHGRFGFQTCLRVPLIFHFPGVLEPRVDAAPVPLLDLSPTLLAFAAEDTAEHARWMSGRSLTPRLLTAQPGPPVVFSEAGYAVRGRWQRVATDGRFKLILAHSHKAQMWLSGVGVKRVLYDLATDPEETTDVSAQHPEDLTRLDSAMRRWLRTENVLELQAKESEAMDEETRRQLEALGYL